MQQDRYCRNCGQELQPEDQFCGNCGRAVHTTAHVPTPEADVPVPPPPQQEEASPQAPQATEQTATPSPQPQERLQWRWKWARGPILLFLVSTFIASVQDIASDPLATGAPMSVLVAANMGATLGRWIVLLASFGLLWLILGGLVYLIARLVGRKPSFFWVLFDWWVVVVVVTPILWGVLVWLL